MGTQWTDSVRFEVSTNPGTAPGPLGKLPRGRTRVFAAIKVALQNADTILTLLTKLDQLRSHRRSGWKTIGKAIRGHKY